MHPYAKPSSRLAFERVAEEGREIRKSDDVRCERARVVGPRKRGIFLFSCTPRALGGTIGRRGNEMSARHKLSVNELSIILSKCSSRCCPRLIPSLPVIAVNHKRIKNGAKVVERLKIYQRYIYIGLRSGRVFTITRYYIRFSVHFIFGCTSTSRVDANYARV